MRVVGYEGDFFGGLRCVIVVGVYVDDVLESFLVVVEVVEFFVD